MQMWRCRRSVINFQAKEAPVIRRISSFASIKRVRGERGRAFSYRDIHKVYTIVFFEQSPESFRRFKEECIHHFTQVSDTGAEIELLQEFCYVCLDIFRDLLHNKGIRNKLDAWLTFLSVDDSEAIEALLDQYPEFGNSTRKFMSCAGMWKGDGDVLGGVT